MRLELRSCVLHDAERDLVATAKFLVEMSSVLIRGITRVTYTGLI